MAEHTFTLDIITPERTEHHDSVLSVNLPGFDGRLGVLARHQPYLVQLREGSVSFNFGRNRVEHHRVRGGFFRVSSGHAILLTRGMD